MRRPQWCEISEGNVGTFVGRYFCHVIPSDLLEKADLNKINLKKKKKA